MQKLPNKCTLCATPEGIFLLEKEDEMTENNRDYYLIDDVKYPRVTSILSEVYRPYDKIDLAVLKNKGNIGSIVHTLTAKHDLDELKEDEVEARYAGYVKAWVDFKENQNALILMIEQLVYDKQKRYAGTFDRIVKLKDHSTVMLDIKTRPFNPLLDPLQLIAYMKAWNSMHANKPITKGMVVQLTKEGKYKIDHAVEIDGIEYTIFISALVTYNYKKRKGYLKNV